MKPSPFNRNLAISVSGANTMKHTDAHKLWESLRDQNTLFGLHSPDEEKRDFRLAKFGLLISGILVGLAGATEVIFLAVLLWQFLK